MQHTLPRRIPLLACFPTDSPLKPPDEERQLVEHATSWNARDNGLHFSRLAERYHQHESSISESSPVPNNPVPHDKTHILEYRV
jgi:hypothetical protein